jgi:phage tail sheath protein FI
MGKKGKNKGGKHSSHYLSPGIYVEEVPSANKPIEAVGTAVAAFVGLSPFSPMRLARTMALAAALTFVARRVR